jgi:hypothetical protein
MAIAVSDRIHGWCDAQLREAIGKPVRPGRMPAIIAALNAVDDRLAGGEVRDVQADPSRQGAQNWDSLACSYGNF